MINRNLPVLHDFDNVHIFSSVMIANAVSATQQRLLGESLVNGMIAAVQLRVA